MLLFRRWVLLFPFGWWVRWLWRACLLFLRLRGVFHWSLFLILFLICFGFGFTQWVFSFCIMLSTTKTFLVLLKALFSLEIGQSLICVSTKKENTPDSLDFGIWSRMWCNCLHRRLSIKVDTKLIVNRITAEPASSLSC